LLYCRPSTTRPPSQTRSASMSSRTARNNGGRFSRFGIEATFATAEWGTGGHLEQIVPSWRKASRLESVEGRLGREGQLSEPHMAAANVVIVRRGHFATFELLTRTFADDPSVQIMWDRRMGERRQNGDRRPESERRRSDRRRTPPKQWVQLNYMIAGEITTRF
jgi:hypothetical protein